MQNTAMTETASTDGNYKMHVQTGDAQISKLHSIDSDSGQPFSCHGPSKQTNWGAIANPVPPRISVQGVGEAVAADQITESE